MFPKLMPPVAPEPEPEPELPEPPEPLEPVLHGLQFVLPPACPITSKAMKVAKITTCFVIFDY
jgi:hypothetical protein